MRTPTYDSDLRDSAWKVLEPLLLARLPRYRRRHRLRDVVDAMLYICRTGCQWRALPVDFPAWSAVRHYFDRWRTTGVWEEVNALTVRLDRRAHAPVGAPGHDGEPSAVTVDAQAVRSGVWGMREARGFNKPKHVNGVSRDIAVDSDGRILACVVRPANHHDSRWLSAVLDEVRWAGFSAAAVCHADAAYRGREEHAAARGMGLRIVTRDEYAKAKALTVKPFVPLPRRWVVERTFALLGWWRRLRNDYERRSDASRTWVMIASVARMLDHLEIS